MTTTNHGRAATGALGIALFWATLFGAVLLLSGCTPPEDGSDATDATSGDGSSASSGDTMRPVTASDVMPQDDVHRDIAANQPAAASGGASSTVDVADVTLTAPAAWSASQSTSSMRVAQFAVPGGGEAVVYFFGQGQGGDVSSNVERWLGQFSSLDGEPSTATKSAADLALTIVRARGTYQSGMPGAATTAMTNHAMVGIIIASPGGPVFIKVTGPAAAIDGAESQVQELLNTIAIRH